MSRYLSVCSGIEAATVAWHPLGWTPVAFSEVDAFPSAVLAHHYPHVPNWGDVTRFQEWPDAVVDVLVGGTPCQSFSVAGLRKGLDDPRGSLLLTYLALARRYRPRWVVWENVPGVLSSDGGRAFGSLLGGLAELGYGFAYRVLDAQYFGLAQRRKRVFVVGCLGDWRRAAAVLFERASLSGHPAPRREAGAGVADFAISGALTSSHTATGLLDPNESTFIPVAFDARQSDVLTYGNQAGPLDTDGHSIAVAFDTTQVTSAANYSNPKPGDPCHPLAAGAHPPAVAFSESGQGWWNEGQVAGTLRAEGENRPSRPSNLAGVGMAVRRLTPRECERLMGLPDDYTLIPYRGKPAADGPRYKALGNSMAVPVMRWLGRRMQMVDAIPQEAA